MQSAAQANAGQKSATKTTASQKLVSGAGDGKKSLGVMYHVAPSRHRESILANGLLPAFGGGFSTGKSPLQGHDVTKEAVYLSSNPGNVGVSGGQPRTVDEPHDVWKVDTSGYQLHPDYPALVEHGMYLGQPGEGFYFDEDDDPVAYELHEQFGESLWTEDMEDDPQPFIDLTSTAGVHEQITPDRLQLVGPYVPGASV